MDAETARRMNQAALDKPPIYDTCEFCQNPVRPGESHGIIDPTIDGPRLICKVQRLELVEREIPGQHPASVLGEKR